MRSNPIKLADLLQQARVGNLPRGFLYLPEEPRAWGTDTDAYMIESYDRDLEANANERGYCSIVDHQTLEDIVRSAYELLKVDSFEGRLEALIYYYRFDAFLPRLGASDPPPPEEIRLQFDRAFYKALGSERRDVPCREPGCDRGAVNLSVFCKVHHFQQIWGRPCPFVD